MFKKHLNKLIAAVLALSVLALANESAQQQQSAENSGYTHVPVNISFVPNVGTGGLAGGKTECNVSFNVLGGSLGTLKGAEFGSIVNIEKKDVYGAQMAGIVNVVGNNTAGVQFAGITNVSARAAHGLQAGGIMNYAGTNSSVLQLGGIANVSGNNDGAQIAGIANVCRNINGVQIGGIANVAKKVNGVQIGLINIAEDINGVPIGLFSYVKSVGLHYQVFVDEIGMTSFAIRNGGEHVYSLLSFGVQGNDVAFAGVFGVGIGGRIPFKEKFFATTDILAQLLYTDDLRHEDTRFISRFRVGGGWQIKPRLALIGGFSVNTYLSKEDDGKTLPKYLPDAEKNNTRWKRVWPGAYIGMEF